jgi:hypothetical protein
MIAAEPVGLAVELVGMVAAEAVGLAAVEPVGLTEQAGCGNG